MTRIDYKTEWYETMKPNYKEFDEALPDFWSMKYEDRWAKILECLPVDKVIEPSLLDVGCGLGRAAWHFKKYGARVKGVEPSDYAIANNRLDKRELIHGDFLTVNIADSFDVVHFEQVLSHMEAYEEVLAKVHWLLVSGGIVVIEEPNDNNPLQQRIMREKGMYWICSDHVNYFTHDDMKDALEEQGFEVIYQGATFPMEFFIMMGMDYIGNDEQGQTCHKMRYQLEKQMGARLRGLLAEKWAEAGIGRDLIIVGRKL